MPDHTKDTENTETFAAIRSTIAENDVTLFMKGTKQAPLCGFSQTVVNILDHLGVAFHSVNVLEDENLRNDIKRFSDWPTIPQLYVKGEFIGGCDIVTEMFQSGDLQSCLAENKIAFQQTG